MPHRINFATVQSKAKGCMWPWHRRQWNVLQRSLRAALSFYLSVGKTAELSKARLFGGPQDLDRLMFFYEWIKSLHCGSVLNIKKIIFLGKKEEGVDAYFRVPFY